MRARPTTRSCAAAARRLSAAGVEVHLDASGDALAARAADAHQEPRRTLRAPPSWRRRAPVACRCSASSSWPGGCSPNEFVAVTGTNGKTTTTEWIGHIHREAALPGRGGRQRRHRAVARWSATLRREATVVCEASSFQLEDTEAFAPEAAVLLNLEPDHLDRHGTLRGLRRGQAADLRQPGQRRRRRRSRPSSAIEDLGGCARRVLLRRRPGRRAVRARRPPVVGRGAAAAERRDLAARRAQPRRTRWPPRRPAWPAGSSPTRSPTGLRTLRRRRAPARADRRPATASPTSTTPRRPTSPARSSRCAATRGGVHLIAGGRGKGQDFSPLAPRGRRALRRRVPDRRGRRRARRGARAGRASRSHELGDLERAVAPRPRAAAPGRDRAALAGLREL